MRRDKKAASGRIRFILLRAIGDVFISDTVIREEVMATLEDIRE
jgi:3-dehydroquinate synthetase